MPRVIEDQLGRPTVLASNGYVLAVRPQPARQANVRANYAVAGNVDWKGPNIGTVPIGLPVGATPVLGGLGSNPGDWIGRNLIDISAEQGVVTMPTSVYLSGVAGALLVGWLARRPLVGIGAGLLIGSLAAAVSRGSTERAVAAAAKNPS